MTMDEVSIYLGGVCMGFALALGIWVFTLRGRR
jgi:hypothetical protein